jgi:N-acetyl-anhydromuramyl-L-alanine amidase AmpD
MPPPLGQIRYLTIHCAATPEGRDVKAESISAWDTAKFGQISYHYVIELDGSVHATLPDTLKGAHVGGANTGNVGVCYVGGVDKAGKPKDTRTPAQSAALRKLVDTYRARIPNLIVRGHRDWPGVAKACPSFDVAAWLNGGAA